MEFLFKILLSVTANISALLLAGYFDKDFLVLSDVEHIVPLAAYLALLNLIVRPLLRLFFSPLIGITPGAFGGGAGGSGSYHTRRGLEKFMFGATVFCGILFVCLAVLNLVIPTL